MMNLQNFKGIPRTPSWGGRPSPDPSPAALCDAPLSNRPPTSNPGYALAADAINTAKLCRAVYDSSYKMAAERMARSNFIPQTQHMRVKQSAISFTTSIYSGPVANALSCNARGHGFATSHLRTTASAIFLYKD